MAEYAIVMLLQTRDLYDTGSLIESANFKYVKVYVSLVLPIWCTKSRLSSAWLERSAVDLNKRLRKPTGPRFEFGRRDIFPIEAEWGKV